MSANPHKWVRKRPADEIDQPDSPEAETTTQTTAASSSGASWKVKTLDEILEEKRRKKLKGESYEGSTDDERLSSSGSPLSKDIKDGANRSRPSSHHSSPAQNQSSKEVVVYELSPEPDCDSILESPGKNSELIKDSKSSKDSTPHSVSEQSEKSALAIPAEEEGEIVSDVSDEEETEETSSDEKRPWRREDKKPAEKEEKMEVITTSQEESESSSEEESDSESGSENESESESYTEEENEVEKVEKTKEIVTEPEIKDSPKLIETAESTTEKKKDEEPAKIIDKQPRNGKETVQESESSEESETGSESESESGSSEESSEEEEEEKKVEVKEQKVQEQEEEMEDVEDLHKELAKFNESRRQRENPKDSKRPENHTSSTARGSRDSSRERHKTLSKQEHARHKHHHDNDNKKHHKHKENDWHREPKLEDVRKQQEDVRRQQEKQRSANSATVKEIVKKPVEKERGVRDSQKSHKTDAHKIDRDAEEKSKTKEKKAKEVKLHGKEKKEKTKEQSKEKRKSPKGKGKNSGEKKIRSERSRRKSLEKKLSKANVKDTKSGSIKLHETDRSKFSTEVVDVEQSDDSSINEEDFESISEGGSPSDSEELSSNVVTMKEELPNYEPAIQGCRSVEEFQWLNRIEEGTYGVVYRAKDKRTGEVVALKKLKMEREREGFPITSLREISTLLKAQHPNIVTVREIVVGNNMDKIYIVMEYVEHDLKTLMEHMSQPFLVGEVKTLMIQLLRAVQHLHDNWILHRDLKASNLLLSNKGMLKVGDFGLAREYGSPLKNYTPIVVTLWYRAPELLLGSKEYSTPVDLWSVGCIFSELLTTKPLFPGKSEIDQINLIFKELGTPSDKIWPGPPSYSELPHVKKMTFTEYPYNSLRNRFGAYLTDNGFDLMNRFLTYDPKKRITAEEALRHAYFDESPKPVDPSMFPSWPAKSEMAKLPKATHRSSPKAPEGGAMFSKLADDPESGQDIAKKLGTRAPPPFSLKF